MSGKPVVIVGAGPTGALLGIELARQGAEVRIIERSPAPPRESRACGIQSRSLELFARLGIADELLSVGNRVRATNFYSGTKPIMRLDFGHLDGPFPFMLQVPQYETQRILDRCLSRLGVEVERGMELVGLRQDSRGVTMQVQRSDGSPERLSSSYAVGCDGAHSVVRHQVEMPFEGQPYEWEWMGADVEVDWAYQESENHLFISREGVLACLPFGGGRWRLITPRVEHPRDRARPPSLDDISAVVARRGPAMQVDKPTWIGSFRSSRRSAPHYRVGRVFLAGDAVHIHSPAAGQGMNTGLGDAANLGWKLGLVATGRAPESLVDTYEPERAPVAAGVIALTHAVIKVFDSTTPFPSVRDRVVPVVSRNGLVQRQLARRMSQHWVSYRGGALSAPAGRSPFRRPVSAGDRAPDVTGLYLGGRATSVFALVKGPEHTVLAAGGSDSHCSGFSFEPFRAALRVFRLSVEQAEAVSEDLLVDPRGRLAKRYGLRPGEVCAIRPDGYVGYIGSAHGLHAYLSKCLLTGFQCGAGYAPSGEVEQGVRALEAAQG